MTAADSALVRRRLIATATAAGVGLAAVGRPTAARAHSGTDYPSLNVRVPTGPHTAVPAAAGVGGDDTAAIQTAITDIAARAGSAGGTVFLPPGVYGISEPIKMRTGVTLLGAGPGRSIMRLLDNEGGPVVTAPASLASTRFAIADLTIDGNKQGCLQGDGTPGSPTGGSCLELVNASRFSLSNVELKDAYNNGVVLAGCRDAVLTNCVIAGASSLAIQANQEEDTSGGHGVAITVHTQTDGQVIRSERIAVCGCVLVDNVHAGINCSAASDCRFVHNTIVKYGTPDLASDAPLCPAEPGCARGLGYGGIRFSNRARRCAARGNVIRGTRRGVFVDGGTEITVTANLIADTSFEGIWFGRYAPSSPPDEADVPRGVVIHGNAIYDSCRRMEGDAVAAAVRLDGIGCIVSANLIRSGVDGSGRRYHDRALWEVAGAADNLITKNLVDGYATSPAIARDDPSNGSLHQDNHVR